eukprot:10396114-Ditylum_brightwellii.AAC.1
MLARIGIVDAPTTSRDPQANLVCKRLHQTVANILRATAPGRANGIQQAVQAVEDAKATMIHATRCALSRSLDLPVIADLVAVRDRRQILIDENLRRHNLKQRE